MNCYDCAQLGRTTAATAVCRRCGAALCPDHVPVASDDIQRVDGRGLTSPTLTAHRLTCHDAEHQP
ncbi:DUF2180 family protein [Actinacidiphila soli]|uniref:DUF2180 family protein n=1 Tax=Actinacidiphila soli TaxID=2487275 RepID=UPI000FCB948D|nr:DUF2180 family protein [Actinacidiphila soli]